MERDLHALPFSLAGAYTSSALRGEPFFCQQGSRCSLHPELLGSPASFPIECVSAEGQEGASIALWSLSVGQCLLSGSHLPGAAGTELSLSLRLLEGFVLCLLSVVDAPGCASDSLGVGFCC